MSSNEEHRTRISTGISQAFRFSPREFVRISDERREEERKAGIDHAPDGTPYLDSFVEAHMPGISDTGDRVFWLDQLFSGGILLPYATGEPSGAHDRALTILLMGPPGTGKTTLATELCYRLANRKPGYSSLYITTEASEEWLKKNAERYGWDNAEQIFRKLRADKGSSLSSGDAVYIDPVANDKEMVRELNTGDDPFGSIKESIVEASTRLRGQRPPRSGSEPVLSHPEIVVLDSLNTVNDAMSGEHGRHRLFARFQEFASSGPKIAILILDGGRDTNEAEFWEYACDILIQMNRNYPADSGNHMLRTIEVVKARYQNHVWGPHQIKIYEPYSIGKGILAQPSKGRTQKTAELIVQKLGSSPLDLKSIVLKDLRRELQIALDDFEDEQDAIWDRAVELAAQVKAKERHEHATPECASEVHWSLSPDKLRFVREKTDTYGPKNQAETQPDEPLEQEGFGPDAWPRWKVDLFKDLQRAYPFRREGGIFIFPSIHYLLSKYKRRNPIGEPEYVRSPIAGLTELLKNQGFPKGRCTALIGSRGGHKSHLGFTQILGGILEEERFFVENGVTEEKRRYLEKAIVISLRDDYSVTRQTMNGILKGWCEQHSGLDPTKFNLDELEKQDRLEIMYFPPGAITAEEFVHRVLVSVMRLKCVNERRDANEESHVSLLFNSLDQLGPRFPLCAGQSVFISGLLQILSAEEVTSYVVAATPDDGNPDPDIHGLHSIAELILSFGPGESDISRDHFWSCLEATEHLQLTMSTKSEIPDMQRVVMLEVERFAGGQTSGSKGILELIDEGHYLCDCLKPRSGLTLLTYMETKG